MTIREHFGDEMNFITKTTVLGIFDFRAYLNIAMLIAESERARLMRQAILDIVIDTINQRTGGMKILSSPTFRKKTIER